VPIARLAAAQAALAHRPVVAAKKAVAKKVVAKKVVKKVVKKVAKKK
jgi:hypothetical protein